MFEDARKKIPSSVNPKDADIWNELNVPGFRSFKVFLHQSDKRLIIVIPTHLSAKHEVFFHVISESLDKDKHNGDYEILSQDEFWEKYKCNFISRIDESASTKIVDLAGILTEHLPEIKKLKTKTNTDVKKTVEYFSTVILNFLMRNASRM